MDTLHSKRYKEFAKKLKLARVEADMTQDQAAQALGRPQSFISDCERRERRVDFIEFLDFAKVYRQPISYFVPKADRLPG
jgi:transcriptional regulator with XRE-family HTH domain